MEEKRQALAGLMDSGSSVVINRRGGYFPFDPESMEILQRNPLVPQTLDDHIVLRESTKIINLENDPDLEAYSVSYMSKIDPNYSYITNLHKFDLETLAEVFTRFKELGGETVFVYTTGINVAQMYEYRNAMLEAGLNHLVLHFNAGMSPEHYEFVDKCLYSAIKIEVLDILTHKKLS